MTHICASKLIIIGSDNGLSHGRCQAIIWTNAGILLIGPLGTHFNEILIAFKKMYLKTSSRKWRPFCPASMCKYTSFVISRKWMIQITFDKLTLVQVMVWCRLATWANVASGLYRHMAPLGRNELSVVIDYPDYAVLSCNLMWETKFSHKVHNDDIHFTLKWRFDVLTPSLPHKCAF